MNERHLPKKIGVCAPSSYIERDVIDRASAFMVGRGYDVFIHPQTFLRDNQSAGTAHQKIDALHDLYRDASIDMIWAAGGGNRALHFIDDLNFDLIAANPKPLIGFSDVTAPLNCIAARCGGVNIHAQVFKNLERYHAIDALDDLSSFKMPIDDAIIVREGHARGRIFGGNLSVFQYLPQSICGDWLDGAILFLEDCHEEISRVDRMLLNMKRSGAFARAGGIVFGKFTDMGDSARPYGFTLEDIIREHCEGLDIPIIMNAPFGHGEDLYPIHVGGIGELDITLTQKSLISRSE